MLRIAFVCLGWSRFGAGRRRGRLASAVEVERGGMPVSEGDPGNWAVVARAINDRVRELGWRQRELAERSHVSVAVVREIQRHTVERRRSPRTLEALSVALGWEPEHLDRVLQGRARQAGGIRQLTVPPCGLALIPSNCSLPSSSSLLTNLGPTLPR